jgi:alkanesulfonate monooxygenase SsuD/methylene tetrahydromethanopterin reductase-like flavin-dependent oxidoreductase (luciferase family)
MSRMTRVSVVMRGEGEGEAAANACRAHDSRRLLSRLTILRPRKRSALTSPMPASYAAGIGEHRCAIHYNPRMELDIFFSISQTEVDGTIPTEREMFRNFFDQVRLADELGFGTAWVAESHLSTETQKLNPGAVIPHFIGEIGLNTDILQLAHRVFARTTRIQIGSAILNILANGGPIAAAERLATFLTLHGLNENEQRAIHIGFASGRFPFINIPYGIVPRSPVEWVAWPVMKGKIFRQATEIFLRLLRGETLDSTMIDPITLLRDDFRSDEEWDKALEAWGQRSEEISVPPFWRFPKLKIVPQEAPMHLLQLLIGSHVPEIQHFANSFLPVGVFNLSITPGKEIEETNQRMKTKFHPDGGGWQRRNMPRTVLVFINEEEGLSAEEKRDAAHREATAALSNYWKALQGTIDPERVAKATDNALVGDAEQILAQAKERFHPEDRLMLWFDFNNHDNERVQRNMRAFRQHVAPRL